MLKKLFIILGIFIYATNICLAEELIKQQSKYPDYAYMYLGNDKYEKIKIPHSGDGANGRFSRV